jgi:hypothetical protein
MLVQLNPRMSFVAPPGKIIYDCDFASQELRTAAAVSKCPVMTAAYTVDEFLYRPDGTPYRNPAADLHTLNAVKCTHPKLFEGVPEDQWDKVARTELPNKVEPRRQGKILSFASIYLSTAQSLSRLNHVPLEEAESWVRNHQKTYPQYYAWAHEFGAIATARGFAIAPWANSIRWVDEANAKGSGESPERSAVNHSIQGLSAMQCKLAAIECYRDRLLRKYDVHVLLPVHDQLTFEGPGSCTLVPEKSKVRNGVYVSLHYEQDDYSKEWTSRVDEIMAGVQTRIFQDLGSPVPGAVEGKAAPMWMH